MVKRNVSPFVELPVIRRIAKNIRQEVLVEGQTQIVEVPKFIKETRYIEKFLAYDITKIEPHLNYITRGKSKTRCEIFYKGDNQKYVITLPMKKVEEIVNSYYKENKNSKIGFKYKNRI